MHKGKVYIVGAGPGRPDLVTVRGLELIKAADCIITDRLVSDLLLEHARSDAEVIRVPKGIGAASTSQDRINELMIQRAAEGKTVVRLKGGDPCIFGRLAEELTAMVCAGIDFEIVPGVTAASAASAYSGAILTDRALSSQVVLVTGHQAEDKAEGVDWSWLARFDGTIVLYMSVRNISHIVASLLENGMDPSMPAAIAVQATLPSQKVVRGRLRDLDRLCEQEGIEPPAVMLIGQVVNLSERFDWFARLPLSGKVIVTTRDHQGNIDMAKLISSMGGVPMAFDTVSLRPLPILDCIGKLGSYDWVVFTSQRGVEYFFEQVRQIGGDARVLGKAGIAVIGPATAAMLGRFGIRPDLVAQPHTSQALARCMVVRANLHHRKVLLLRSQLADQQLKRVLESAGAQVEQVSVYTIESVSGDAASLARKIQEDRVHWLTFASASEAHSFLGQIEPGLVNASGVRVASIGPQTSAELVRLGVRVDLEAGTHTIEGLVQAIAGQAV